MNYYAAIRFCAEECERQKSGEMSVYNMFLAYKHTMDWHDCHAPLTVSFVQRIGAFIEPEQNKNGFRTVPVHFRNNTFALSPGLIEHAMQSLIYHGQNLSAEEGYIEFQRIHPFIDGNGRVGAILYNIWLGTLNQPVTAPDFFGGKR